MTPARILVSFVVAGVILGFLGLYAKLIDIGGAGATVPIIGSGNTLAKGVLKGISEKGFIGIFTGGISAAAGGIAASIFFGFLMAIIFKPKQK
jgi:stage V sporulation protein AE